MTGNRNRSVGQLMAMGYSKFPYLSYYTDPSVHDYVLCVSYSGLDNVSLDNRKTDT